MGGIAALSASACRDAMRRDDGAETVRPFWKAAADFVFPTTCRPSRVPLSDMTLFELLRIDAAAAAQDVMA